MHLGPCPVSAREHHHCSQVHGRSQALATFSGLSFWRQSCPSPGYLLCRQVHGHVCLLVLHLQQPTGGHTYVLLFCCWKNEVVLLGLLRVPAGLRPIDKGPILPAMFSATDQEKLTAVVFHWLNIIPGGAKMTSSDPPGALMDASVNGTIKWLFSTALDSGRGGDAMMRSTNTIMFFVQVCKRYRKCYSSNNICLILLPCPWSMCEVITNMTPC